MPDPEALVNCGVALLAEALLLVAVHPDAHPGRLVALGANQLNRSERDGARLLEHPALGVLRVTALLHVPLDQAQTLDRQAVGLAVDLDDLAALLGLGGRALGARNHLHGVADLELFHYSTSGASEMI